jgi:hypothetical protein
VHLPELLEPGTNNRTKLRIIGKVTDPAGEVPGVPSQAEPMPGKRHDEKNAEGEPLEFQVGYHCMLIDSEGRRILFTNHVIVNGVKNQTLIEAF